MMLSLYRLASGPLGAPFITAFLNKRLRDGKEDANRFSERLGEPGMARPAAGRLIWIHAASVGESLSMLPLVERLLKDDPALALVITTGTVSSAKLLAERLPSGAIHQYAPVDRAKYVRRFVDHWRPDLVLWAESEFWPNLIIETTNAGVPMILVNGRVSPKAFAGWGRAPGVIAKLLRRFQLCFAQSEEDAIRLGQLGANHSEYLGNLKFAAPELPADPAALNELERMFGDRPRWLSASTHAGEEAMIADAHRKIAADHPGLLSIIVPRHAGRGVEVTEMLKNRGFRVARRTAADPIDAETEIYVADTMGELGLFFRATPISFMGKSLVRLGGQNPLEALRLGSAVLHGPHMM
ncbi:MAG: 3-deoxy-D-manno-octulosonic acid transferase, partial [Rhodospirillales bacterium]|nr:3-deoxy-D-manno-octulosonic acid transferase [Rhodospirillales bacterium]